MTARLTIPESARLPAYHGEFGPDDGRPRKVLVSPVLMVQMAEAASQHRITIDWGQPDADGFYTPIVTQHEPLP